MASKLGILAPQLCFSPTSINPKTAICTRRRIKWSFHEQQIVRVSSDCVVVVVRAASGSGPNSPEPTSPTNSRNSLPSPTPQDDLTYVLMLAAGSFLGAALIKYGSAIIPDITTPNINLALLMISTPAVVAVLLLFNSSRKE